MASRRLARGARLRRRGGAALVGAVGTVVDATGTVGTPAGTSPGSGGIDAAVLRIAP
jgi:hypothetical protein